MKVQMSGTRNGEEWPAKGEVADLPTAEAAHLCSAGIAEPVADKAEPETATAPDTAEKRGGRSRARKPHADEGDAAKE